MVVGARIPRPTFVGAYRLPSMARHSAPRARHCEHRLPVRLTVDGVDQVQRSSGLAAALDAVRGDATWVGGRSSHPHCRSAPDKRLSTDHLHPVSSAEEEEDFYGKVCNDTLWPLFHYFQGRLRITPEAGAVRGGRALRRHDRRAPRRPTRASVHDFHLMLVPAMLRAREPRLSIGFFRTSRSIPRCTACCRASRSCAGCSEPTTSASRSATMHGTSARPASACSASTPSRTGSSSTAVGSASASIRSASTWPAFAR